MFFSSSKQKYLIIFFILNICFLVARRFFIYIYQNNPVWYCFLRLPSLIGLQKFGPPAQERDVPTISRQTFGPWVACLSLYLSIYQPLSTPTVLTTQQTDTIFSFLFAQNK